MMYVRVIVELCTFKKWAVCTSERDRFLKEVKVLRLFISDHKPKSSNVDSNNEEQEQRLADFTTKSQEHDRVKPKTIKCVLVSSPLSKQH
jgi:hypothetical protein